MKLYARGPRMIRQVLEDLFILAWAALWLALSRFVHRTVNATGAPARKSAQITQGIIDDLDAMQRTLARIPAVGDELGIPFRALVRRLQDLVAQNQAQAEQAANSATTAAVFVFLVPVAIMVTLWLPRRLRFMRESALSQPHIDDDADLDLYALRAMANVPMVELAKVSSDPAAAWRRGDLDVIWRLAALELARVGLKPPSGRPQRPAPTPDEGAGPGSGDQATSR